MGAHDMDPWGEASYLDVRHRMTLGHASAHEETTSVIDGLRQRIHQLEGELSMARGGNRQGHPASPTSGQQFSPATRASGNIDSAKKSSQEAKQLAQELLESL